jgi:hypothetical protein
LHQAALGLGEFAHDGDLGHAVFGVVGHGLRLVPLRGWRKVADCGVCVVGVKGCEYIDFG